MNMARRERVRSLRGQMRWLAYGAVAGIYARPASLTESEISHNRTSDNGGNGINMFSSGSLIRHNEADNNVVAGITAFPGATGNRFEHNSMHGNGSSAGASFPGADASDLNPSSTARCKTSGSATNATPTSRPT